MERVVTVAEAHELFSATHDYTANFAVAFVKIVGDEDDALPAGSGTLVTAGGALRHPDGGPCDRGAAKEQRVRLPSTEIKHDLELNYVSVPTANKQYGPKGWLFAIAARILEDQNLVEYRKVDSRSFYRSK